MKIRTSGKVNNEQVVIDGGYRDIPLKVISLFPSK